MEFISETKREEMSKFKVKYRERELTDKGLFTVSWLGSDFLMYCYDWTLHESNVLHPASSERNIVQMKSITAVKVWESPPPVY